jgi:hypothetical protein
MDQSNFKVYLLPTLIDKVAHALQGTAPLAQPLKAQLARLL